MSLIGGVNVHVEQPGTYQFEYMLEPLSGKFAHLEGAQIIVIKGLDLDKENEVGTDQVRHLTYSYAGVKAFEFNIPEPGSYTIGFGPYEGTLLPESIVRSDDDANAVGIRFKLKRFSDAKTLEDSGYRFDRFVDLLLEKKGGGGEYLVHPIVKEYDFMSQGPGATFSMALDDIPGIRMETKKWILSEYQLAAQAGHSNVHPFGKELQYAKHQLSNVRAVLTNDNYKWNNSELKDVSAARIGLYLWQLAGKKNELLKEINGLLARENYAQLLDKLEVTMEEILPDWFPEFQTSMKVTK